MSHRGLLLTITEPPPAMEEEFNAWYDTEHLAERLAIPGFRSTRRWVADCAPGRDFWFVDLEGRLAPCSFVDAAVPLAALRTQADLDALPAALAAERARRQPAACADCPSTQQHEKFG